MENFADLQSLCLKIFEEVAKSCSVFILPLFIGRIVFSNIVGSGSQAFSVLKGAVIYFCLVAGFPIVLEILFSIPESYLPHMDSVLTMSGSGSFEGINIIPFALDRILEVILAALFWIAYYLHAFFMLLMCSMAPIIFLTSTFLGVGLGVEIFFGLLIVGSSWPIIWHGFDVVHAVLINSQTDEFAAKCLGILITLFKALSPVAFASLAIKSPAGQILTRATRGSISSSKWLVTDGPKTYRQAVRNTNQIVNRMRNFRNPSQTAGNPMVKGKPLFTGNDSRLIKARRQDERDKK